MRAVNTWPLTIKTSQCTVPQTMGLGQVVNLASQNGQECTGGLNPGNTVDNPGWVTTEMNIVLSEGFFDLQGRVEVRKNGIWGSICNDNTDEYNYTNCTSPGSCGDGQTWSSDQALDDRAAEVICRQMGYTAGRLVELSIVPDGTNQIWMDNLNCPTWPSNISFWQNSTNGNQDSQWGTNLCSIQDWKDLNCGSPHRFDTRLQNS